MTKGLNTCLAGFIIAMLVLEVTTGGHGGVAWNTGGREYGYGGGDRSSEESHERHPRHGQQGYGHNQQPLYGGHPTYIQRPMQHSGYAHAYGSQHGHTGLLHKVAGKFHG